MPFSLPHYPFKCCFIVWTSFSNNVSRFFQMFWIMRMSIMGSNCFYYIISFFRQYQIIFFNKTFYLSFCYDQSKCIFFPFFYLFYFSKIAFVFINSIIILLRLLSLSFHFFILTIHIILLCYIIF